MTNQSSTEEIANRSSSDIVERQISELQALIRETFNEQIRGFIAHLTHQLEELTRLVQGMTTSRNQISYLRSELGTTSGTAMPQSEMVTGIHRTRHRRQSMTSPETDDETTYPEYDRQFRPPTPPEMTDS